MGNYAGVHTEWAEVKGSGWSPAYNITTLLINIQSILHDSLTESKESDNLKLYEDCIQYALNHDIPKIYTKEEIEQMNKKDHLYTPNNNLDTKNESKLNVNHSSNHPNGLIIRNEGRIPITAMARNSLENFYLILNDEYQREIFQNIIDYFTHDKPIQSNLFPNNTTSTTNTTNDNAESNDIIAATEMDHTKPVLDTSISPTPILDPSICCWFTQLNYTDDVLGYGIKIVRKYEPHHQDCNSDRMMIHTKEIKKSSTHTINDKIITTDGNFISYSAFRDGLRHTPINDTFDEFLPAWINETDHAGKNEDWIHQMKKSLERMGKVLKCNNYQDAAKKFFPEIINSMIVNMMNRCSEYRASEKLFQCIINLWRCYYHISNLFPVLKNKIKEEIQNFYTNKMSQRKDSCPNLGWLLVNTTILLPTEYDWMEFLTALNHESFLRRVLWWQKDDITISNESTFQHDEISMKLILFQTTFQRIIGSCNRQELLLDIEKSNSQLPILLGILLNEWKLVVKRLQDHPTWSQYFTELHINEVENLNAYLEDIVTKANAIPGYFYTARRNYNNSSNGEMRKIENRKVW